MLPPPKRHQNSPRQWEFRTRCIPPRIRHPGHASHCESRTYDRSHDTEYKFASRSFSRILPMKSVGLLIGSTQWSGSMGIVKFNTSIHMPRHVHLSSKKHGSGQRLVAERITVLNGVAVTEQAGQLFVIPPNSQVLATAGVSYAWTAAPAGIDLSALGISDEPLVSTGKFTAVFETTSRRRICRVSGFRSWG